MLSASCSDLLQLQATAALHSPAPHSPALHSPALHSPALFEPTQKSAFHTAARPPCTPDSSASKNTTSSRGMNRGSALRVSSSSCSNLQDLHAPPSTSASPPAASPTAASPLAASPTAAIIPSRADSSSANGFCNSATAASNVGVAAGQQWSSVGTARRVVPANGFFRSASTSSSCSDLEELRAAAAAVSAGAGAGAAAVFPCTGGPEMQVPRFSANLSSPESAIS
ncbi:unnamed protein product, partial [Closterium sp. NIES-53]